MVSYACLISALCFLIANAMNIAMDVKNARFFMGNDDIYSKMISLDETFVRKSWAHRSDVFLLERLGSVFNLFGWLFFVVPVQQLAWGLSLGGKRLVGNHVSMVVFALVGCFTEILSRLLSIGSWGTMNWISKNFTLTNWTNNGGYDDDDVGWKTLEILYRIMHGLIFYIDAFEWICLFFVMILFYTSLATYDKRHRPLGLGFGRVGLVIAFLSFLDFAANLLQVESWKVFAPMVLLLTIVNTCILLPLWLVWLGCFIYRVNPTTNENDNIYEEDPVWGGTGTAAAADPSPGVVVVEQ